MTREEFIELEFGDRVYWDPIGGENRVVNGHVAETKFLNEKKAICMAFHWEDWGTGGMPRYVSERDMKFIAGLRKSQVVTSKKAEDFPNVWTGYVSKEEVEKLSHEIHYLKERTSSVEFAMGFCCLVCGLITTLFLILAVCGFIDIVKTVLNSF